MYVWNSHLKYRTPWGQSCPPNHSICSANMRMFGCMQCIPMACFFLHCLKYKKKSTFKNKGLKGECKVGLEKKFIKMQRIYIHIFFLLTMLNQILKLRYVFYMAINQLFFMLFDDSFTERKVKLMYNGKKNTIGYYWYLHFK